MCKENIHPHYDLIVWWAENPSENKIQYKSHFSGKWVDTDGPGWDPKTEYRKAPKQMINKYRWLLVYPGGDATLTPYKLSEKEVDERYTNFSRKEKIPETEQLFNQ